MIWLARLFAFGVGLAVLAGAGLAWVLLEFDRPGPLAQDTVVLVPSGVGVAAIAQSLERDGVIRDARLFMAGHAMAGRGETLKAGEFRIPAAASARQVFDVLARGRSVSHGITVPEGLTSREILEIVAASEVLAGPVPDTVPQQGSLLPDTYAVTRNDSRQSVLDRMAAEMDRARAALWPTRAEGLPLASWDEAVILASIVEKETGQAEERPLVAAVFVNRLNRGMRLQSDPTVIFALTEGERPLGRALTRRDWQVDHPYNTYRIPGLPPGPIAHPGRASLEAVLNPPETPFLFFVADGTGGHAFAETLAEHNRNVARWRRIRDGG